MILCTGMDIRLGHVIFCHWILNLEVFIYENANLLTEKKKIFIFSQIFDHTNNHTVSLKQNLNISILI